MPAAKKPATRKSPARRTTRASTGKTSTSTTARREVEQRIAQFDKLLGDAGDALQTLGKHAGKGAQNTYGDLTKALKALRRDAERTNRQLLKDLDKLVAVVTPAKTAARTSSKSPSRSRNTAAATSSRSAARSSGRRASASKPRASK